MLPCAVRLRDAKVFLLRTACPVFSGSPRLMLSCGISQLLLLTFLGLQGSITRIILSLALCSSVFARQCRTS
jgi:hypothetical protein